MTEKDKKIIADAEKNNTPIFVFTAKDIKSVRQLMRYRDDCAFDCSNKHYQGIEKRISEFVNWQNDNEDKVELPD